MTVNGSAVYGNLNPGHFLFTSESVGEGHPGMLELSSVVHPNNLSGIRQDLRPDLGRYCECREYFGLTVLSDYFLCKRSSMPV